MLVLGSNEPARLSSTLNATTFSAIFRDEATSTFVSPIFSANTFAIRATSLSGVVASMANAPRRSPSFKAAIAAGCSIVSV